MSASPGRIKRALVQLATLKQFPRETDVRREIGLMLDRFCRDDMHIDAVIERLVNGDQDTWQGPATLRKTAEEFRSQSSAAPTDFDELKAKWEAERPPDDCPRCIGGMNRRGKGSWERCACRWGARVTDSELDLANLLSRPETLPISADPMQFESWPRTGRVRDRALAKRRGEISRERRATTEDESIQ